MPRPSDDDPKGWRPHHPSPRHPGDDAMPPYSPGGVPAPDRDEKANGDDRLAPAYPPKRPA